MNPDLIKRLTHWYWSPDLPTCYITKGGGGIGKLAFKYPAAFNLAWAKYGPGLTTHATEKVHLIQHTAAITYLSRVNRLVDHKYGAYELSTYVTLMTRTEFEKFYIRQARDTLPVPLVELIDEAIHAQV